MPETTPTPTKPKTPKVSDAFVLEAQAFIFFLHGAPYDGDEASALAAWRTGGKDGDALRQAAKDRLAVFLKSMEAAGLKTTFFDSKKVTKYVEFIVTVPAHPAYVL